MFINATLLFSHSLLALFSTFLSLSTCPMLFCFPLLAHIVLLSHTRACVRLWPPVPLAAVCVCVWISRIFQFFPHRSLVFSLLSYDVCFVLWTVEKVYALAEQLPQRPLSLVAFALTPSRTCGSTKDAVRGDTEERSRHTCIRAT